MKPESKSQTSLRSRLGDLPTAEVSPRIQKVHHFFVKYFKDGQTRRTILKFSQSDLSPELATREFPSLRGSTVQTLLRIPG